MTPLKKTADCYVYAMLLLVKDDDLNVIGRYLQRADEGPASLLASIPQASSRWTPGHYNLQRRGAEHHPGIWAWVLTTV